MPEIKESALATLESKKTALETQIQTVQDQFGLLRLKLTEGGAATEEDRRESERLYHELSRLNSELEMVKQDIDHILR